MCLQSLHPSVLWGLLISNDLWPPLISMGFLLQYIKVWNSTNYYICCTLLNHFHVLTYIDLKWPLASTNVWRFMYKTHWRGSADGTNYEDLPSFTFAYMYHATKFSDFELHWPQNQMISTYTNFNTILVLFKVQYRAIYHVWSFSKHWFLQLSCLQGLQTNLKWTLTPTNFNTVMSFHLK